MNEREIWSAQAKLISKSAGLGTKLELSPYFESVAKDDFKMFGVGLSRYKFAGKLIEGKENVIEIGCNSGFGTRMLLQFVNEVLGGDFDEDAIEFAKEHYANERLHFTYMDIVNDTVFVNEHSNHFDAAVSLDVIEHISMENETDFLKHICSLVNQNGVVIIGTPNITASEYQSEISRAGHINLYSAERLKTLMNQFFFNVFMFGMNDELVHTGFLPMAHYLFAVGVGKRKRV